MGCGQPYITDSNCIFTSPRRLCFRLSLFYCQQDYAQTTGQIFMKLGGKVKHWPRKNPFHFGANTQIIVSLSLTLKDREFVLHSCVVRKSGKKLFPIIFHDLPETFPSLFSVMHILETAINVLFKCSEQSNNTSSL